MVGIEYKKAKVNATVNRYTKEKAEREYIGEGKPFSSMSDFVNTAMIRLVRDLEKEEIKAEG